MSVLGGVKSGDREIDAYERTQKTFKNEVVSEVEKMSKVMRMNLLKLRKESKRIEFMTVTGQMRALNDIKVKDMKASEDALSGNILDAEELERNYLKSSQEEDARNKLKIQGIKAEMKRIITLIKELHVQSSMAKSAAQTYARVQGLIEEKRESMAQAASRLDERERKERLALESSHVRLANNLKEWQRLELQGYDEGEQERVRRLNKLRASQLKEVQQKEREQLKEVQRLKAQSLVVMNDLDLEHLMHIEAMKADQLVRIDEVEIALRKNRRELKEEIKTLRNESRAAVLKEGFQITGENLRNSQVVRAEKQRLAQEKKRVDAAAALENEVQLKLEDLEAGLDAMGEYLSSDSDRTGSSRSRSTGKSSSKGAASSLGGDEARQEELDAEQEVEAEKAKQNKDTSSSTEKISKNPALYEHSNALTRAEERLMSSQLEMKEKKEREVEVQKEELEAAVLDYEDKRRKLIAENEQKLFALMKQHSEDKAEVTKGHEREIQARLSTMLIEKEFESTRSKAEEFSRQMGADFKGLLSSLKTTTNEMAKSLPKDSNQAAQATETLKQITNQANEMNRTIANVLEYTHLVQTGSAGKLALDVKFSTLFDGALNMLKTTVKDAERSLRIKHSIDDTIQQTIRISVTDLHSVLSKMLVYMMSISKADEMHFHASQEGQHLHFSITDKTPNVDVLEVKALEKAIKRTNLSMNSDRRSLFGILIVQILLGNMDGELSVKATPGTGIKLTASVPVTKEQ